MKNLLLALIVALVPVQVFGLAIGVFADPAGTDCNLAIPYPGGPITAYVVATIDGEAPDGVVAASFRIAGLPAGWTASISSVDPAANLALGQPFVDGAILAYPGSVSGDRVLMTISIHPSGLVQNGALVILPHADMFAQRCGFEGIPCGAPCPRFCSFNGFGLDCLCAEPRGSTINGNPCVVSTRGAAWSRIKELYR